MIILGHERVFSQACPLLFSFCDEVRRFWQVSANTANRDGLFIYDYVNIPPGYWGWQLEAKLSGWCNYKSSLIIHAVDILSFPFNADPLNAVIRMRKTLGKDVRLFSIRGLRSERSAERQPPFLLAPCVCMKGSFACSFAQMRCTRSVRAEVEGNGTVK